MATNFWELLQQRRSKLTKAGRIVADYLMQHADEAQYLSISSLARECQVAEATVFRFCRALGFEGYHEMRIALAQANVTGSPGPQQELGPDASTAVLCDRASTLFLAAISGTQQLLQPESIDTASRLLHAARQVFCFGQGSGMLLANEIWAKFAGLSTRFHTAGDDCMQRVTAAQLGPEDAILFVSCSDPDPDRLETLRTARRTGARVVLLTYCEDPSAAALADVVLQCGAQERTLVSGSFPTGVAILYAAQVLLLRYMLDDAAQENSVS